jgi:hypothetical protein
MLKRVERSEPAQRKAALRELRSLADQAGFMREQATGLKSPFLAFLLGMVQIEAGRLSEGPPLPD